MRLEILWLAHRDPLHPRAGGAERSISEICSRLSVFGHNVTVLSAGWKGCKGQDIVNGFRIKRFGNSLSIHFYVPLFILKQKPDMVVNDLGHAVPWPSSFLLKKKGIVFFRHLHARSLPGQVNRILAFLIAAIEKSYFILYHNYKFITESTTSVADLMRIGIRDSNIVKITPGVDTTVYKVSKKTQEPSLVYFGGMRKYKRPRDIVSIFMKLRLEVPNLRLTIIGSGPELIRVKEMVESMGLGSTVSFTGKIPDESLALIVSNSWVNLHTSQTEGWGLSILEAASAGTPTVAYSVPGVIDAIEDGQNGFKVKDNDKDAFADVVLEILINPAPLWESSRKVAEKYSWDITARFWDRTIREEMQTP